MVNLVMSFQVIVRILTASFIEFRNECKAFSINLSVEAGLTSLIFVLCSANIII